MKTDEKSMKTVEQACKNQNRWNDSFQRQNAADSMKMMQKLWIKKEVQNATNTVEIAVSRFKMLQIAKNMDRTVNPKKIPKRKKNPQTIPDPKYNIHSVFTFTYYMYTIYV